MSIKDSKKVYYLWSTRKLEQLQSFRTGYYKAGQIDRKCCTWKLYKDGQTWCAVHIPQNSCLSASAALGLAICIYKGHFGEKQILQISRWKLNHMIWLHLSISCQWNIFLIFTNCSKTLFTCRVGNLSNSWQERQSRLGLFCTSTRRGVDQGHVWNQFQKVWFINIHQAPCIKNILRAFCPQSEVVTYCTLP